MAKHFLLFASLIKFMNMGYSWASWYIMFAEFKSWMVFASYEVSLYGIYMSLSIKQAMF
jgi:hypothetical protein